MTAHHEGLLAEAHRKDPDGYHRACRIDPDVCTLCDTEAAEAEEARDLVARFEPGWLQRQVANSVAAMESLPPGIRASLRPLRDRRQP